MLNDFFSDFQKHENKICSEASEDFVTPIDGVEEVKERCLPDPTCKGFYYEVDPKTFQTRFMKCIKGYRIIDKTHDKQSEFHLKGML